MGRSVGPRGSSPLLGAPPQGRGPELSLSLQASRYRSRRRNLSPLPSASDTEWPGSLGVRSPRRWSPSRGPRQPKNLGSQGLQDKSWDKVAPDPGSSTVGTGTLRRSWDAPASSRDGGPPHDTPGWGSGPAPRPWPRRRFLEDDPGGGGRQQWAREPPVRARPGAKDRSLGTVAWTYL